MTLHASLPNGLLSWQNTACCFGKFDLILLSTLTTLSAALTSEMIFGGCHRQPLYCFHSEFRYIRTPTIGNWARIRALKLR